MRFYESPKRALFSIPFELADGFIIGTKGYGLVTEQKKGAYKYFVDLGDKMEVVDSRTTYVDEVRTHSYKPSAFSHPNPFRTGARGGSRQEQRTVWPDGGCDRRRRGRRRARVRNTFCRCWPTRKPSILPSFHSLISPSGLLHCRRSALFPHPRP